MKKEEYAAQPLATLKELAKGRKMRGTSTMKKSDLIEALMAYDAAHAESVEKAAESAEESRSQEAGEYAQFSTKGRKTRRRQSRETVRRKVQPL